MGGGRQKLSECDTEWGHCHTKLGIRFSICTNMYYRESEGGEGLGFWCLFRPTNFSQQ